MEFRLYHRAHYGNVIFKMAGEGVPVMCCGQKMEGFVPSTTDGAMEKHVLAVEKIAHGSGYSVSVKVGSVEHPILPEHCISMITAADGDTATMKFPKPGRKPELKTFCRSEKVETYEICNLHNFWKGEGREGPYFTRNLV